MISNQAHFLSQSIELLSCLCAFLCGSGVLLGHLGDSLNRLSYRSAGRTLFVNGVRYFANHPYSFTGTFSNFPNHFTGATSARDTPGNLFDSTAPDKGVGLSLSIPIRNRAAQAQQIRSELEYRQAQLRIQQQQNQVGIDVRNAQFALQQNRARVQAAIEGQRLAEQSLDTEQKKYTLGASTNTLVLQAQNDLSVAASTTLTAKSAYEKSRVQLDLITGNTLQHLGINLDDAAAGVVKALPTVQGVQPNPNPGVTTAQPPATPNPSSN